MGQDNVLGIQATINGKDVQNGANEFIRQINRMELASNNFTSSLANKAQMVNGEVREIGNTFDGVVSSIVKGAAAMGVAFSAQQFASQVMRVRGEFQQLEVAFSTMLDSAEKANDLMTQLTRTAAITPFGLQDVAGGAKQLLAYGVAAENVNDTLVRLGDIAAGLSIPLNDLVYLYGTTMTQGRMFTQDLRQFQGRGIPLADELAKQFGVTKDKVGELVTAGKVGFDEMHKAIVSLTSDGGKFGGLMEAQSKTITGQISNIEDAIDSMFNEIGKSSEGVINAGLNTVSSLVENWRDVADAIGLAVTAYGSYKAAIMVAAAVGSIQKGVAASEEIKGLSELLLVKEKSKNADLESAVASGKLTKAKADELASLRAEAAARLEVLNIKKAEAIEEEKIALEAFQVAKKEKDAADEKLENMFNLMEAAEEQGDASYIAYAQEQLQTASANANTAATRLNTAEKNLNAASSKAKATSEAADTMATNVNTVANNANTASMNIMKAAALQLQGILKGLWATLMANPLALVGAAIGLLTYGIYSFVTRETAAEKATKKFNEAIEEQQKKADEHKKKIDGLVNSLGNLELSEGTRLENFMALKQEYPEILKNISTENDFLREKHKILQQINQEQKKETQKSDKKILEEAEERLKYFQDRWNKGYTVSNVSEDGGYNPGSTLDAMNAWKDKVDRAKARVAAPEVENFLVRLKDFKSEDIESVLEEVTITIQSLENAGDNAIGLVSSISDDVKEFSKTQLQNIRLALDGELENRGGEKKTASQWLAKYKKEYEASQKALTDFQKKRNEISEIEYERQLKELTDARDAAKKKYEEAGGSVKADDKSIENQQKISDELLSIRRKNQQDEINLMQEGSKKRLKQIELDYQKELDEIKKQERALKEKQGGNLTYEQKSAITNRGLIAEKTRAKAILEVEKELIEKYQSNAQKRLEIEKKYNKDIQELQEARVIAEERGDKIAVDNFTKSIAKATSDKGKALIAHDLDVLKESPEYIRAFEDLNNTSTETLQNLLIELERVKQAAAESYDVENLKEYTDAIKAIHDELVERNPFQGLIESHKELIANKEKLKEYADIIEVINSGGTVLKTSRLNNEGKIENVYWTLDEALKAYNRTKDASIKSESKFFKNLDTTKAQIDELSNSIKVLGDSIGGSIGGIISLIGDVSLAVTYTIDGMAKVAATGANALSAVEKASVILGIISTAIQLLNKISSLFADSFQQYQAYAEKVKEINTLSDAVNQYRMALIEARHEEENWFSVNNLKNLKDYKEIQTQALEDYLEKLYQEQAIYQNQGGGGWLTTIWKPITEFIDATLGNIYGFEINKDYQKGTTSARNNLRIETRKKSSGFLGTGIGGKSQKTENLEEWVRKNGLGELFDDNGFVNIQLAQSIIDQFGDKLVGETKETLEELIELRHQYDEYIKQLREYVSSMYEPLVDNFVDSLWAWFDEGKDALDSFKEYASDTFRDIVSDMMRTIVLEQVVGSFSDDIADIYEKYATGQLSEDELMKEVAKRTEGLIDNYEANIPALQDLMNNVNEAFKAAGIDLSEAAAYSQEASSKGFQAMSQDTGDELNGRFTALQTAGEEIKNQSQQQTVLQTLISTDTSAIKQDIAIQKQYISEIVDIQYESVGYLAEISKNTKQLYEMNERLGKIEENTRNI